MALEMTPFNKSHMTIPCNIYTFWSNVGTSMHFFRDRAYSYKFATLVKALYDLSKNSEAVICMA